MLGHFWKGLAPASRVGLVTGALLIAAALAGLAAWLLRTDHAVLFADLSPPDAAAMTAELERMKVPYTLAADGTSILVARSAVPQTRLELMSRELPLQGAVGFELFNQSDFGMTEFAQKVNYQRALQGELTRTLRALDQVESVRVHLALPEERLFERERVRPKAVISLATRGGTPLSPAQVSGIQRLVSAAVPGIAPHDVTLVDARGIALTRAGGELGGPPPSGHLELKQEVEQHLSRKATAVLDGMFGAGHSLASVDVSLDMSQVRVTTEDVTAPPAPPGEAPTGVIVRERETVRDEPGTATAGDGAAGTVQRETEYQVGRRVHQRVSQPGSVQRLQVLAVVRAALDAGQLQQVRALLGVAVGASRERGDEVLVHAVAPPTFDNPGATAVAASPASVDEPPGAPRSGERGIGGVARIPMQAAVPVALAASAAAVWLGWLLRRRRACEASAPTALDARQREAALARLRGWLDGAGRLPRGPAS